jgi:thiol-disulfide isomerase/thioredoxin
MNRSCLAALLLALILPLSQEARADKAIDFEFADVAGKTLRLSEFKGQWVLVNFWAPWCPLCWAEVATLVALDQRKDFAVIGIGLDYGADAGEAKRTAEKHDFDVEAIVAGGSRRDPDSPYRQVGPVDFFPTSYLYDPDGEIVMFVPGQVREGKLLGFMEDWNWEHAGGKKGSGR